MAKIIVEWNNVTDDDKAGLITEFLKGQSEKPILGACSVKKAYLGACCVKKAYFGSML